MRKIFTTENDTEHDIDHDGFEDTFVEDEYENICEGENNNGK